MRRAFEQAVLEVIVDGVIFQFQSRGGVSRIYSEILPRMCEQDESLRITLLTREGRAPLQPLPAHPLITRRAVPHLDPYLRPWRLWGRYSPAVKRLMNKLWVGDGAGKIWHSTYFTQPDEWRGAQVVTVVDMIYELYPNFFNAPADDQFREQKRRAVSDAEAIICISETTSRDVQEYYGVSSDKTFVVPLAHSDTFQPLENGASGETRPYLLYVGRRAHYKNFDLVLEAYSSWTERDAVDLIVVGDRGWTPDEERRLNELNLSSRVKLMTDVDDEQLRRLYGRAAAFVYPSLYEGFGIPLLEAMACGCPVVSSDIPSSREVAGDCAIYFEPSSAEDLRAVLERVVAEGPNDTRRAAGIARAATFSWDETARQTLAVYHSVGS
jgi:glycosyltransferase involved in cell wall biosynthesis